MPPTPASAPVPAPDRPDTVRTDASRAQRRLALLETGVGPLLVARSWSGIRLADVTRAAGVSRQTLYDEFGTRDGLARAYVVTVTGFSPPPDRRRPSAQNTAGGSATNRQNGCPAGSA